MDGQSHLLLIREEAGPPDAQVRERKRKSGSYSLPSYPPFSLLSHALFSSFPSSLHLLFHISHPSSPLLPLIFSYSFFAFSQSSPLCLLLFLISSPLLFIFSALPLSSPPLLLILTSPLSPFHQLSFISSSCSPSLHHLILRLSVFSSHSSFRLLLLPLFLLPPCSSAAGWTPSSWSSAWRTRPASWSCTSCSAS